MIKSWIGYLLSISNWISLTGTAIIISYLFFANMQERPPLTIDKIEIINPNILPNEPLKLKIHALINKADCDMYAERIVTSAINSETIWQSVTPINLHVLSKEITSEVPLEIVIPNIRPGSYFYYTKIHMICGNNVEIIPTKLLPFRVVDPLK